MLWLRNKKTDKLMGGSVQVKAKHLSFQFLLVGSIIMNYYYYDPLEYEETGNISIWASE